MSPDVSIVIPVHGRRRMLETAVASVERQISPELTVEAIVVDDGSSPPIQLEPKAWLTIVRLEENFGAPTARNKGLERASGRWVKYLDSDDLLVDGTLTEEVRLGDQTGADIVVTSMIETRCQDAVWTITRRRAAPRFESIEDDLLEPRAVINSAALYRGDLARSIHSRELRRLVDWDYFCRAALEARSIATLDRDSYVWRHHDGERVTTGTTPYDLAVEQQYVVRNIEETLRARGRLTPERRRALARLFFRRLPKIAVVDSDLAIEVVTRICQLDPRFVPRPGSAIGFLLGRFGIEVGMSLYATLARGRALLRFDSAPLTYESPASPPEARRRPPPDRSRSSP